MSNRLKLDFSLNTTAERISFINSYLSQPQFLTRPPTEAELETISNFILWGKDPKTGLNSKQSHEIQLESNYSPWNQKSQARLQSLDELIEKPTFNESQIFQLGEIKLKANRHVLDREQIRRSCPHAFLEIFEDLWKRIDELEFQIQEWELAHEKRKTPIRAQLLERILEERQKELREKALSWSPSQHLKKKRLLVELRRDQYGIKDGFQEQMLCGQQTPVLEVEEMPELRIAAAPLGLKNGSEFASLAFLSFADLVPQNFSEEQLLVVTRDYWKQKEVSLDRNIDLRDTDVLARLIAAINEIKTYATDTNDFAALAQTLEYYIAATTLEDSYRMILDMKIKKFKNNEIAEKINQEFGKKYTDNYISTIFHQRIIPKIAATVKLHQDIIENLCFQENFKTCADCGKTKLLCTDNFMRRGRSKDGFSNRCKPCDKARRLKQQEENNEKTRTIKLVLG